ncbi:MAG: class I SAM-dependent rRNA methyltransferase [candidate division KSB1 bacterium]|nr:class I SAM-dependent rRNA methyltransferase [candidate division KSB1 bacterium]MDZ7274758.1 class I SAM-dependent rRNA methyltransferase [candidate division KSB1 bacterium]MDZ7285583.1 class I SAM-dependent rRNA methyltransferase [candidate division KSB1 bacterium]MDZ7298615.1 class I SAM-dependent rRNA methyltransferase [candidate division KSB1 bacterium]MDZ7307624.1 class I SAM-dependent rRNA methyltransferase [candidate division KSB1 bacterium]
MPKLFLKPGRDRAVRRFHPWIFSGAVARLEGAAEPGAVVEVYSAEAAFLARGFYNPRSQIVCRLLTWQEQEIGRDFFRERIAAAYHSRLRLWPAAEVTDSFRVVNAEGDGLPGLIVDKYADFLVVQLGTLGMAARRELLCEVLQEVIAPRGIFEKSAGPALLEEGLAPTVQVVRGEAPPETIVIRENNLWFEVNVSSGQKTGFFLDQRDNRAWVARLSAGRSVLNGFGYTGAFSVYAAKAGARSVVTVDSSSAAVTLAKENFRRNSLAVLPENFVTADLFRYLRETTQQFDFIILDPPAFAHRQKEVDNAARAYKDINLQALKLIAPGGLLLTCSCSQPVSPELFQKILFAAAVDAGRRVRILGQSGHAPDHPISLYHPEGRYLQAVLLAVD